MINKLTTKELQLIAQKWLLQKSNIYQALNFSKCYFHEADVLGITNSGIITEIEVKVSRMDFKADFNKKHKHRMMKSGECKPNKFYYISNGCITKHDIPEYAGLLEVDNHLNIHVIKTAPMIHKNKCDNDLIIAIAKHLTAYSILGCQPMTHKNRIAKGEILDNNKDLLKWQK